jgi:hypothetical protein
MERLKHLFGFCFKANQGYTCHGANNYEECGEPWYRQYEQ